MQVGIIFLYINEFLETYRYMNNISDKDISRVHLPVSGEFVLVPIAVWEEIQKNYAKNTGEVIENHQSFGALLKHYRLKNDYNQKELADKSNMKECQISNFENNKKEPRPVSLAKLSKTLGVDFTAKAKEILLKKQ